MLPDDEIVSAAFDSDRPELLGFWKHPLHCCVFPEAARYALPSVSDSNNKYNTWSDW